jgi:hypothetical protein
LEELEREFEAVLDELLTFIVSTDSGFEKLFKRIATLQKEANNACHVFPVKQLKTESGRLEMELVLSKADVDELYFNERESKPVLRKTKTAGITPWRWRPIRWANRELALTFRRQPRNSATRRSEPRL